MKAFQQRLLIGLAFLLPFTVIVVLLREAIKVAKRITAPVLPYFSDLLFGGVGAATLLAVLFLVGLCWSASWLAGTGRGGRVKAWLEKFMIPLIPGYSMIRTLLNDVAGRRDDEEVIPVLARIEDAWQWGFITDTLESGLLAVYVPEAPAVTTGAIYFLTEDRVKRIDVPTQKIYGNIRRYGLGSKNLLKGKI